MTVSTKAPTVAMPRRRTIGGVPAYVVDGPAPARCALMFRVGRADETLPLSGITHMVEHLALFGQTDDACRYNGFVDAHRTVFHAAGTEDECVRFLAGVAASLADLPVHRLEQERRVLEAEEAGSGTGLLGAMAIHRFGARGLGLVGYDQLGLHTIDADALDEWVAAHFTAGNAVLALSGVDPRRVELELPPGPRRPVAEPEPVEDELPGWFSLRLQGVGLSFLARRSPAVDVGLRVLQKRLFRRLRTELAIVYSVKVDVHVVDADVGHVVLACDPTESSVPEAQAAIDQELAALAADGPWADELEAERQARRRRWAEPDAGVWLAHTLAFDELLGAERTTPAKVRKAEQSVTAADVAAAIAVGRQTAMWALPVGSEGPPGVPRIAGTSPRRLEGRRLPPTAPPADDASPQVALVLGDTGVGFENAQGWHVHVEFARCAGALAWRDGVRTLIGDDGFTVTVKPWDWDGGTKAVAEIDARVPAELVVPMGDGDGPPPPPPPPPPPLAPAAAGPSGPPPQSFGARFRRAGAVVAFCVFALLAAVLSVGRPQLKPGDVEGVARSRVPVTPGGLVDCGGSTVSIWRHGARVPDVGPQTATVARACEKEAGDSAAGTGLSVAICVGIAGWCAFRRHQVAASSHT